VCGGAGRAACEKQGTAFESLSAVSNDACSGVSEADVDVSSPNPLDERVCTNGDGMNVDSSPPSESWALRLFSTPATSAIACSITMRVRRPMWRTFACETKHEPRRPSGVAVGSWAQVLRNAQHCAALRQSHSQVSSRCLRGAVHWSVSCGPLWRDHWSALGLQAAVEPRRVDLEIDCQPLLRQVDLHEGCATEGHTLSMPLPTPNTRP
jgi:hypothetical protein